MFSIVSSCDGKLWWNVRTADLATMNEKSLPNFQMSVGKPHDKSKAPNVSFSFSWGRYTERNLPEILRQVCPSIRLFDKFKRLSICRRRACVSLLVLVKSNKWDGIKTLVYDIEKLNVWNIDNKSTHILEANYLLKRIDFLWRNIFIWLRVSFFVWYMCFVFLEFLKSIASSLQPSFRFLEICWFNLLKVL
jgi:hypothetical protein